MDRGRKYDGDTDRVLLFSDDGPTTNTVEGPFPHALLNGEAQPAPLTLRFGAPRQGPIPAQTTSVAVQVRQGWGSESGVRVKGQSKGSE